MSKIRGQGPVFGCLLLSAAYLAIAVTTLSGHHSLPLLVTLLGIGGLGLGVQFSALIAHLTATVPVRHAADISGVSGTIMLIGGAVSIATFGTLYLGLASHATTAFGLTTIALAAAALIASLAAYRATRPAPTGSPDLATPAPATPALATPAGRVRGRDSARPWWEDINS